MFENYLKIAIRNLVRHKAYSFINIAGLAIGMACCLLILLYVRNELSHDNFHTNADRIYRVGRISQLGNNIRQDARSPVPLGPTLKHEFPELESVIRFWRSFDPVLSYQQRHFREDNNLYFSDTDVFEVFSFDLIKGNPKTALKSPNSIVITEAMALKYFGTDEPIGKIMTFRGFPADSLDLVVTGVMQDLPDNTHFDFEFLVSLVGVETEKDNWGSFKSIWTYVLLPENYSALNLESRFPAFVDRYIKYSDTRNELHLELLSDLHLFSRFPGGFKASLDFAYIYLFSAIGIFILLIACINFMNLATARSMSRAKEIGLRKVLGAYRAQLIKQFIGEAFFLSTIALLLAVVLIELFLPVFNVTFSRNLNIDYFRDWFVFAALLTIVLVVGLLAGSYPAFFLSRFRPIVTLRGKFVSSGSGAKLRKGLIVLQFAISIVLIIGTILVYRQLEFINSKNLGFDKEQVIVLPYSNNEKALTSELLGHPNITSVSISQRVPVNLKNSDGRTILPEGFESRVTVESYIIDDNFLNTYRIDLVAGKNLSSNPGLAKDEFLINETAAKQLGWLPFVKAIGKRLVWSGNKAGRIVGVIKDFHVASLHEQIEPLVLHSIPVKRYWRTFMSVRLIPEDIATTLKLIESTWRRFTPEGAYEYFFIDESLQLLHQDDKRLGEIFGYFSVLAILIACLGLFGLASFTAEQRKNEIGVRKMLGASVPSVVFLLSKEFTKHVIVSFLLAIPIGFFLMNRWLENFAYRINIGVEGFLLAGSLTLVIALLTVSYQAVQAALAKPVDSIRYE